MVSLQLVSFLRFFFEIFPCFPCGANRDVTVRIKVSSWVSNFVSEMRTKSPAVVQRWVDSLPTESVTEIPGDTLTETTDISQQNTNSTLTNVKQCKYYEEICDSTTPNITIAEPSIVDISKEVDKLNVQTDDDDDDYDGDEDEDDDDEHKNEETDRESDCRKGEYEPKAPVNLNACDTIDSGTESTDSERRFWKKGASVLTALRIRSGTDSTRNIETEDLNVSSQLCESDEPEKSTPINPILNKTKFNEFYCKLNISKKRYNFIKDRRMEAKKLLNNAKSRFLAAAHWDEAAQIVDGEHDNPENQVTANEQQGDNELMDNADATATMTETSSDTETKTAAISSGPIAATTTIKRTATATETVQNQPESSGGNVSGVCDTIDMDLSADEFSRLSQSNDMLSNADDEDSFNVSMPSIDSHTTHLNVSRRIAMADIGRSTSDNPRLRNKFYLADIGRSFSEHQDDEAIMIGERNISAPSSSIAIQNNNRSNGNFYERRAYSVSPTQRGLKRGILSRDHSLSDSSRHRNQLSKGSSFQSDSSHCSSVESLLDARKPDSEAILRQLGFGPAHQEDLLSRIPKR